MRRELARVFGELRADEQLRRYHDVEPELESNGRLSYREVLTEAMKRLGASDDDAGALADSLPSWQPFPEVPASLEEVRSRGWKLAILSNSDRDFIEASMKQIGVEFELAVVASEICSYKPGLRHWERFFEQTGARPERHVHVAASLFHDVAPAGELGLASVWINRLRERPGPRPTRELADLAPLPDALDELVSP
jgi:2-haloacid dehalogenase